MESVDLLNRYSGIIDVFVLLENARQYESFVDEKLGQRANKVYFTPSNSHRSPGRNQRVEGQYDKIRPALIFDIGFWTGASFKETLDFLLKTGYEIKNIYAWYISGNTSPDGPVDEVRSTFETAENLLKRLPK